MESVGVSAHWNRFLDAPNGVLVGSGLVLAGAGGVAFHDWPFATAGLFMAGVGGGSAVAGRIIRRRRLGEVCRVRAKDAVIAAATRIDPMGDADDVASARIALRALVHADLRAAEAARLSCLRSASRGTTAGVDGWLDAAVEIASARDAVREPV
jgi:hypothetical protein